ncbi:alpha/beta fold hydrolase [soil metagenome]
MLPLLIAAALTLAAPTSTEVTLLSAPAALHGTLLMPGASTSAVAVILPGSGPTDRDGNSAQAGVVASNLRMLAEGLADRGVATLRIDKRGIAASSAAGLDESALRFQAYAEDARAWAAEAAAQTGQPCAWLIGHSEGSLVALQAVQVAPGQTPDDKICGVISLSGAGRPAGAVLREQLAAVPEPLKTQAFAALSELEAGRTVADPPAQLAALFRPSVQPYLISWLPLDPAALAHAYAGPLLIGQGTTDIQVSMADAQALAAARPDATFARFEGANHLLKIAPADRAANIATYRDPALPLAAGVVDAVADFIAAH